MGEGFNLLHEPWVPVLDLRGRERQLSVPEVFEQAPGVVSIAGDVPTQDFAILRLLLAFLHRALEGPEDGEDWEELWSAGALPTDRIARYAERVENRFDLFDESAPFFQVPGLRTEKDEVSGLDRLVADVPNGEPLFTTRSAASLACMEPAEAGRWLVHAHAFDPSGIKSGVVGDHNAKRGKSYPIGTGWSGWLGGVVPQGSNLRETLLLNLIGREFGTYVRIGGQEDLPPWEREVDKPAGAEDRPPRGAIDLYTWQTRRVRLVGNRSGVTGVVLSNGDRIPPRNLHRLEPHSVWRYSEPQSKSFKEPVYMPQSHDPARSVWRGIGAMLPSTAGRYTAGKSGQPKHIAPGVLQWIAHLVAQGHLDEEFRARVRAIGVEYGSQSSTYAEIVDDSIPVAVALLRHDDPALGQLAEQAVSDADGAAGALWIFAENLAQAAGAEARSGAGDEAREQLYAALDAPYRAWLARLDTGSDLPEARAIWQRWVHRACLQLAGELLATASPAAWTGRTINDRLVNVPLAEVWFRAALRTKLALVHAHIPDESALQEER
ncbi:type I-E CRISPR-associated protein Cse1/CasA [Haloechinothrix sp. LS1_15]|uniref:type I-E CRISPR-associated protein Cse1/CasA n=1 Tax=Haloechinothrix sp. LS1_15 TaxID=2652248 RepID=UPI0029450AB3|nr:type I-E CRISPR-associated protein Cse1/CasA [Haloechinothrix sp. LS1_15]MDV6013055.1 type I-E CRISPR-associated protein Cse1/CasA [Haloechinothrix sp. LS1_15]